MHNSQTLRHTRNLATILFLLPLLVSHASVSRHFPMGGAGAGLDAEKFGFQLHHLRPISQTSVCCDFSRTMVINSLLLLDVNTPTVVVLHTRVLNQDCVITLLKTKVFNMILLSLLETGKQQIPLLTQM